MGWGNHRALQMEILDEPEAGLEKLRSSLRFMEWTNRWLGGAGPILDFFEQRVGAEKCTVLDLGTGGGDIPFVLAKWADENGKRMDITAIDIHSACLEYARGRHQHPRIRYVRHSAFDFEELGQFDYIIASMFFHHLPDEKIVELLQKMFQHARRGFIVNDLYRHPVAYWGVALLSAMTLDPVVFHDARLSVKRGFREEDAHNYRDWSGVDGMRIEQRPGFRLTMSYHH
jgi:2-polyprenyl-3-methyl-5-hydroxy-6-metoxy-1,4-benzoquinol methylase